MIPFKLRIIREQNRIYSFILKLISSVQTGPKVFLFHDLLDNKADVKTEFAISQASFETFLLRQIKKDKKALTFHQLTQQIEGKAPKDKNTFYVTFDDCNTSVYTKAYPFLKEHHIPFILFITKDLIGKKNFLSSEQIIELANDPLCTVGSHALHHVMFRYLSVEETENELENSKIYLEAMTGKPVTCFAFPYGRLVECSCKNIQTLSTSVYDFSFSAIEGNLSQQGLTGKFYLPRINVSEEMVSKH